jgi:hypothetical protein
VAFDALLAIGARTGPIGAAFEGDQIPTVANTVNNTANSSLFIDASTLFCSETGSACGAHHCFIARREESTGL